MRARADLVSRIWPFSFDAKDVKSDTPCSRSQLEVMSQEKVQLFKFAYRESRGQMKRVERPDNCGKGFASPLQDGVAKRLDG